jgi:hypothetical protein
MRSPTLKVPHRAGENGGTRYSFIYGNIGILLSLCNSDGQLSCRNHLDEKWIGSYLTFTEPQPRWRIDRKLAENEDLATEADVKECKARSVFVCLNVPTKETVVKIWMRYVVSWIRKWFGEAMCLRDSC